MIPVRITELSTTGPRVRMNACPSCSRPLVLDHCGVVEDGEQYLDVAAVDTAQRLHLRSCSG